MASPSKFLVRTWLPGKGCVHVRSTALTEGEARELYDASSEAIVLAQESGTIEKVNLKQGFAFVKALRLPDPDQPGRMTPGFVLLSVPDPHAFLRDAVAREFDELLSFAANQALSSIPPIVQASDLDRRGVKMLDLGGTPPPSGSEAWSRSWNQWQVRVKAVGLRCIAVIAVITVAILGWPWIVSKFTAPKNTQPRASTANQDGGTDPDQQKWDRGREQILKLLEEPWAEKLLGDKTSPEANGTEVLRRFTRLYVRPNLEGTLGTDSYPYYKLKMAKLEAASEHPFSAFLSRLPEKISISLVDEAVFSPTAAMKYLEELQGELKSKEMSRGIDLDLSDIDNLSEKAGRSLSYGKFYDEWIITSKHAGRPIDKWDVDREITESEYAWVAKVRNFIKDCYPQY